MVALAERSTDTISAAATRVLERATVASDRVKLPPAQLERALYEEVNEVLVRLGGKWNGSKKVHLFPYDPTALLEAVIESGVLPLKNPYAYFPTPAPAVDTLFSVALLRERLSECEFTRLGAGARVLEPSAGTGAIARRLQEEVAWAMESRLRFDLDPTPITLDVCELDPVNRTALERLGLRVVANDFLGYEPGPVYERIVMNPPFTTPTDSTAYITHVRHAFALLANEGILAAIVPAGAKYVSSKVVSDFRDFVYEYGGFEHLPPGAFKESGTGVSTTIVYLKKEDVSWKDEPRNGFPSWKMWILDMIKDNSHELDQRRDRLYGQIDKGVLVRNLIGDPMPDLKQAIHSYWDAVYAEARAGGEPITLTKQDFLVAEGLFLSDYDDDCAIRAESE